MRSLFQSILDWCFPPSESSLRVRSVSPENLNVLPVYHNTYATSLLSFKEPNVRALIHEAKFHYNRRAHMILGIILKKYIDEHFPNAVLVPIPLHPARERARGFNQVSAVIQSCPSLARQLDAQLIRRTKNTRTQRSLSAKARHDNVQGAFTAHLRHVKALPSDQPIVIIDDVYTTGSTLEAARTALTSICENPVYGLTLAYA